MHGIDKIQAARAFTAYADYRAAQGRALRDEGIREMKADGTLMPKIAEETGIPLGTVKAICRMATIPDLVAAIIAASEDGKP